jgi:uncharacterized protein (TIGR02145 family)
MNKFYIALFLLLFTSISYSQNPCPGLDSLNYSGQWYHTVQIGSQCWLKDNLNIGTMMAAVTNQKDNDTIEKYCFNNDPSMCNIYGGLYQWREAMQYSQKQGARGICPIGWHIPAYSEFYALSLTVNGDGNALKQIGQGGGTNTSGFSALLTGYNIYTSFGDLGIRTEFWNSYSFYMLHSDPYEAGHLELWNDQTINSSRYHNAEFGFSVRCLKDTGGLSLQAPYGGENWQIGSNHKISWGGDLVNKKMKIEYSSNNGDDWIEIINSIQAVNGEINWTIPNTPSVNCIVKITDLNNPTSFSICDSAFSIYSTCFGGSTIIHRGRTYNKVVIGNKCWFKENLDIGIFILGSQSPAANDTIEKYCYNDDTANCSIYGALYKLSEMKEKNFCPTFWHTPTNSELTTLSSKVIYDGNALKEIGQGSGFGVGANTSGFSALMAGIRNFDGTFHYLGTGSFFPIEYYLAKVDVYYLDGSTSLTEFLFDGANPDIAGSTRCIMDDVGLLKLKSPIGGENWLIGSNQKISWTLSNVINIRIDYSTDNGTNWINIIPSTPTSAGNFIWTIPNTPSKECEIRIASVNNPDSSSVSNKFLIYPIPSIPCPGLPSIIYDHQNYNTVAIGDQCWIKENLNIGTRINGIQNQTNNGVIEKYCYNDDTANCTRYGGLYLWDEAMQYDTLSGAKGICPSGWHIPLWTEFANLVTNTYNDGKNLLSIGQGLGNNSSGFSALLAGARSNNGLPVGLGYLAEFIGYGYDLSIESNTVDKQIIYKDLGISVRCINDSSISAIPVELTSFIFLLNDNNVKLNWTTATEVNTSSFDIEKKSDGNNSWQKIASIKASGNSTILKQYFYIDKNVNSGKYNYRLKMNDLDGSYKYSNVINAEISVPANFELSNAYPNPWNPTTTIRYQVPINIHVTIKVFDALGREVSTLVNEVKPAGNYEVTFNAKGLSSGTYYYQMIAGNFIETKKIMMIR